MYGPHKTIGVTVIEDATPTKEPEEGEPGEVVTSESKSGRPRGRPKMSAFDRRTREEQEAGRQAIARRSKLQ